MPLQVSGICGDRDCGHFTVALKQNKILPVLFRNPTGFLCWLNAWLDYVCSDDRVLSEFHPDINLGDSLRFHRRS